MTFPPPFAGYPRSDANAEYEREKRIGGPGWEPGWSRVWRDGVDVTDTVDPAEWPYPWNPVKRPGQS